MDEIPVRRIPFEFPADMDLVFVEDDPELSYTFVGTWFMLPYLEPYLIRSMQAALEHVQDAGKQEEMRRFIQQESQHYRQHARANATIRNIKPAYAKLAELEKQLDEEFKQFSREKPLLWNLAYAEGFECMTAAASSVQVEQGLFADSGHPLRQLALWHVTEELEHRNVAFDAYAALKGSYLYRLRIGLWAQRHFLGWGMKLAKVLKDADPDVFARYDNPESIARRNARRKRYWNAVLPRWLAIYTPWYSPRKLALPANFEATREQLSRMASTIN